MAEMVATTTTDLENAVAETECCAFTCVYLYFCNALWESNPNETPQSSIVITRT